MYTNDEFEVLTRKYGKYASWAIWDYVKSRIMEKSAHIIFENYQECHSRYVIVGLNISSMVDVWGNFRGGRHDRKLKYAFNSSFVRGAYMTDLFKDIVEVNSSNLSKLISKVKFSENVNLFVEEMKDIGVTDETIFIIMGTETSITGKFFKKHFRPYFLNNEILFHRHYSSRGTDKKWVDSIWNDLNIDEDFDKLVLRYQ